MTRDAMPIPDLPMPRYEYQREGIDGVIIPPSGLVESRGWMPIETAPMDGTEVVLYYPHLRDDGFVTAGYWHRATDDYESHWYSDLVNGGASPPTHWMPLPAPPTESK